MTDQEAEQEIRAQLEPGENLIWSGAPRQGFLLRKQDTFLIPFSVVWMAFAVLFLWGSLASDVPAAFVVGGIALVVGGGYALSTRLPTETKIRGRTAYGLTDRRVIMIGGSPHRVRSVLLHELLGLTLQTESDGTGNVWFLPSDPISRLSYWPFMSQRPASMAHLGFECIESAEKVHQLVREAELQAWAEIRRRTRPTHS